MAEVKAGWLQGPVYEAAAVEEIIGEKCVISQRFPLMQGEKGRAIDDLNESNVDLISGCYDAISFHVVDVIATMVNVVLLVKRRWPHTHRGIRKPSYWEGVQIWQGLTSSGL